MVSKRRAARAGGARSKSGEPPRALLSRQDPTWSDPDLVQALVANYGLQVEVSSDWPVWRQFDAVRFAWCASQGLLDGPSRINFTAAKALGVDVSGGARWRLHRL